MDKVIQAVKIALSFFAGILAYIFGPWNGAMAILVCMVIIDYITGVIAAAVNGRLSSKTGFRGILKKIVIFMVVALAALCDRLLPFTNFAIRTAVCMFYIANEAISVLENAGSIGLPLPDVLKTAIEKLKSDKDN